jgi:hypothetical protein
MNRTIMKKIITNYQFFNWITSKKTEIILTITDKIFYSDVGNFIGKKI